MHAIDPGNVGLSGFGLPSGLGERQVRRWSQQWERPKSRHVPAVDELARRLPAHPPTGPGGAIVHGDFRLLAAERRAQTGADPGAEHAARLPAPLLPGRTVRQAGRADLGELPAWVALAHFKSAVIAQGIAARVEAGSMAGQEFGDIMLIPNERWFLPG